MAGIFMSNDGSMGQLIGAALTGSDPYAGNLAQGWAQTENARIAQERLKMDMDVKRREIEQAQREQEAFRQRAGMETAGTLQQFSRGMTPLAPTMAPLTSFMPPPGGPMPTLTQLPAGQTQATPLNQNAEQRVAPQITPEQAQDLDLHIQTFTRGAKTADEFLKLSAQAKRAWAAKHGVPLGMDDAIGIQTGVHGLGALEPGRQATAEQRQAIGSEANRRKLAGESYAIPTGPTAHGADVQAAFGLPQQTDRMDPKTLIDFRKTIDASDGVKKMRDITPAITSAETILADRTLSSSPTLQAALVTYAAKIADPTTGVREGEIDKWGGQGYGDRIRGIIAAAQGGGRLQPAAIEELRKFFQITRQRYGEIAATELGELKRIADASGIPWETVKPNILTPGAGVSAAPGGAAATAPAADPSRPVFVIPGAGSAQSSATAAAPANGPGSQAQPVAIGGPLDVPKQVPIGGWYKTPDGRVLQRSK